MLFVSTCVRVCPRQALMQVHDSLAGQETTEESVIQYLGETVKLVRLEKTRDTPLVRICPSVLQSDSDLSCLSIRRTLLSLLPGCDST